MKDRKKIRYKKEKRRFRKVKNEDKIRNVQ